jgi:hypothetical protein
MNGSFCAISTFLSTSQIRAPEMLTAASLQLSELLSTISSCLNCGWMAGSLPGLARQLIQNWQFFWSPGLYFLFPNSFLRTVSSSMSDHCMLILTGESDHAVLKDFRFEDYWTQQRGFLDLVLISWNNLVSPSDHIRSLHIKFCRVAKALRLWIWRRIGNIKLLTAVVEHVILGVGTRLHTRSAGFDHCRDSPSTISQGKKSSFCLPLHVCASVNTPEFSGWVRPTPR